MSSSVIDSLIQAIAQDTADKILAQVEEGLGNVKVTAVVEEAEADTSEEDAAAAKKAEAAKKRKAAAAKKKAEAEAAAAEEEEIDDGLGLDDEDDAPTREQVRDALKEYAGVEGKAAAIAILNDNGAKSMGELDEGNFQAVLDACTA